MMHVVNAVSRAALMCAIVGALAEAQARPNLSIAGDLKHWESYFDHGVKVLRATPREAEMAFAWATRLDPTRAEPSFAYAHVGLAHVARAEQKHADASESLTLALDLAPDDGTVWNFLAISKMSQSQYDAAATAAERASTLLPQWPAPVYVMAQARERQGRHGEARELYTKFVGMAPDNDPQARAIRQRLGIGAP